MVTLASLESDDKITFPRLQQLLGMTAGNLATHLRKLEDAEYITSTKAYRRRTPVTYIALTRAGRNALDDYTAALRGLLGGVGRTEGETGQPDRGTGQLTKGETQP